MATQVIHTCLAGSTHCDHAGWRCLKRVYTGLILLIAAFVLVTFASIDTVYAQEDNVLVRGNPVPLTARLLQNGTYGDPVSYQRLDFYDQSQDTLIDSTMTDANGYATVIWNISPDYPLGPSILNVTFEGNDSLSLAPSYQWVSVSIVSETTIEVQVSTFTIHPEDEVSLTVKLIDDRATPISDASISIYSDAIQVSSATTNGTGYVTFLLNCNSSWCSIGTNTLRAIYNGDLMHFYNASESIFQIEVQQITTNLEVQSSVESEIQLNKSYRLQTSIQADGIPHPGVPLTVLLDDSPIDTVTSDEYGMIDLTLDIDHQYTLGLHTLRMEYQGTFRYAPSHLEIDITVSSPALIHLEFPEQVIEGMNTEVQVSLQDIFQRPIFNAFIAIHDGLSNVTYEISFPPEQSSTTTLIVFEGPVGPRHLEITVSGSPNLTNTTNQITVIIWTQPRLTVVQSSTYGYASPSQRLSFEVQLNVSRNPASDRSIEWRIGESASNSVVTNQNGIADFLFTAPTMEGLYVLTMEYSGSQMLYELPIFLDYEIIVSWIMPVKVDLLSYSISSVLQKITVRLSIMALNGTALEGITLYYEWLDYQDSIPSMEAGIIELALRVPEDSGTYSLYYETEESPYLQSTTGHHIIIISQSESMASQGVGIPILAFSLGASISIAIIPILWRRRIID